MSAIASKVAVKVLKGRAEQYQPADPHYEEITNANGKTKRKIRDVPAGLSKRDEKILRKIRKRAHYLDKGMNLCGFRVGWTFFIGFIPLLGDIVNAFLNYNLVVKPAKRLDLPSDLVARMQLNNAVSAGLGFIPVAGDIALAVWKANSRNAHLVEAFLVIRGQEHLAQLHQGASPISAQEAASAGVSQAEVANVFGAGAGMDRGSGSATAVRENGRVQGPPVTAPRPRRK